MCGGGSDVTQTNQRSKQTYTPEGKGTFEDIIASGQAAASLPYTPITQGVANLTPGQLQAQASMGIASPYMAQAAAHFENSAQPLTAANINQYYNPYASAVTANMNEVFGQQQRDTTGKLTGAAGGIGADRIGVGQAELARQQGLAAGQTYAGLYQNALGAAQNQQGIEQAAAYGLGNLSQAQMSQFMNQWALGTGEQQTEQMRLNAAYNQQMAEAAYPFQTAQWYAGMALPAAGAMGGTTQGRQSGTVNPADPNAASGILGGAIAGGSAGSAFGPWGAGIGAIGGGIMGAFKRLGGGIRRAPGGQINGFAAGGSPYAGSAGSYVPDIQLPGMSQQSGLSPLQFMNMSAPQAGGTAAGGVGGKGSNVQSGGLASLFGGDGGAAENMGWSTTVQPTWAGMGNMLSNAFSARGGGVHESEPYKILTQIARGNGGEVESNSLTKQDRDSAGQSFHMDMITPGVADDAVEDLLAGRWSDAPAKTHNTPPVNYGHDQMFQARGGKVGKFAYGGVPGWDGTPFNVDQDPYEVNPITPAGNVKGFGRLLAPPKAFPERYENQGEPRTDPLPKIPEAFQPITTRGETAMIRRPFQGSAIAKTTPGNSPAVALPASTDQPFQMLDSASGVDGFSLGETAVTQPDGPGASPFQVAQGDTGDVAQSGYYAGQSVPNPGAYTFPRDGSGDQKIIGVNGNAPPGPGQQAGGFPDEETGPHETGQPGVAGSPGTGRWSQAFGSVPPYERPKLFGHELSNMQLAGIAGGLGIMGGASPYFGVNVGQGGLKGIETLKDFQQMDAERQAKALQNMLEAGRLDVAERGQELSESQKPFQLLDAIDKYELNSGDAAGAEIKRNRVYEMFPEVLGDRPSRQGTVPEGFAGEGSHPEKEYESVPVAGTPFSVSLPKGADPTRAVDWRANVPDQKTIDSYVNPSGGIVPKTKQTYIKTTTAQVLKDAETKYEGAREVKNQLDQMIGKIHDQDPTGFLAPGSFQNERAAAYTALTTIKAMLSPKDKAITDSLLKNLEKSGNLEAIRKLQTQLGFSLARTLGTREAMQVIQQALASVPGLGMTLAGQMNVFYGMKSGIDAGLDRNLFLKQWAGTSSFGSIDGAQDRFDNVVGRDENYVSRAEALRDLDFKRMTSNAQPGDPAYEKAKCYMQNKLLVDPSEYGFAGDVNCE